MALTKVLSILLFCTIYLTSYGYAEGTKDPTEAAKAALDKLSTPTNIADEDLIKHLSAELDKFKSAVLAIVPNSIPMDHPLVENCIQYLEGPIGTLNTATQDDLNGCDGNNCPEQTKDDYSHRLEMLLGWTGECIAYNLNPSNTEEDNEE